MSRLEDLFHRGNLANTALLEQFNKEMEQFNTQANTSWGQLQKVLQTAYIDTIEKTIDTNAQGGIGLRGLKVYLQTTMTKEFSTMNPGTEIIDTYEIMTKEQINEKTKGSDCNS